MMISSHIAEVMLPMLSHPFAKLTKYVQPDRRGVTLGEHPCHNQIVQSPRHPGLD
jgi:hypothetical protein